MALTISVAQFPAPQRTRRPFIVKAAQTVWTWRQKAAARADLRRLLDRADDRVLADVGLNRAALADEAGKAFWQD